MSDRPKSRKMKIAFIAFITLLLSSIGLFIKEILHVNILGTIIQFLTFLVLAIVAYDITKDGKKFYKSFYKIAYIISIIIVAIFIIVPFVKEVIELLS